jgi:hypothetical protein
MTLPRLTAVILALGFSDLACKTGSDGDSGLTRTLGGYRYSYAVPDCAPWDGAATTIYLTATPVDSTDVVYPHLRVSIYQGVAALPGNSFEWSRDAQVGGAVQCVSLTSCEAATSAHVTFGGKGPDGSLRGTADLVFPSGTTLRGSFRATWREQRVLCG